MFISRCTSFFSYLKLIFKLRRSGFSLNYIRDMVRFQKALEDLHRVDCSFKDSIKQHFDSSPCSSFLLEH